MGTSTNIKTQLTNDMKTAMREKNKTQLDAVRMILASVKQYEVDYRAEADDETMLVLLDKMLKQRRESVKQYLEAKRDDLADKENFEISVIQKYLPAPLSDKELQQLIKSTITELNANSMQDMGKVMAQLKPQVQGRADMSNVSKTIKALLSGN